MTRDLEAENALLRSILGKLRAAQIVEPGDRGLPDVQDGSDGWRETTLTVAEADLFAAITKEPT